MKTARSLVLLLQIVGALTITALNLRGLKPLLSPGSTISSNSSALPRWSDFDAPNPGAVINVATERDVSVTVRYAVKHNVSFLAQNGGHGWSTTLAALQRDGIIINLAGLKQISFNPAKTQITFQGGALVSDVVNAANASKALVPTGTCNCIGMLGAVLGGGVGNLMGSYGLGIDNVLSMEVVTARGHALTVSPSLNPDLWFAMRGAGPNFGIVTSAVMKSYPVHADGMNAWLGPLVFTSPQLEPLIAAINHLEFTPQMALSLLFVSSGNTSAPPAIICSVYYHGSETSGKAAFAPIYALGPVADKTDVTAYAQWNTANNVACAKGLRKPNFGVGLAQMDPPTWRAVYTAFSAWIQKPGAENSTVMMDAYPLTQTQTVPDAASAYPFRRSIRFNAIWAALYADLSLDGTAVQYGTKARNLWRASSGLRANETYINNAFGDESLQTVYGASLQKLQSIKKARDPGNFFSSWFPLL